jgi:hypothetical protein
MPYKMLLHHVNLNICTAFFWRKKTAAAHFCETGQNSFSPCISTSLCFIKANSNTVTRAQTGLLLSQTSEMCCNLIKILENVLREVDIMITILDIFCRKFGEKLAFKKWYD